MTANHLGDGPLAESAVEPRMASGTLRDQHHALTRELILRAFVEQLEAGELSEITIPDVAKAAGVSVRTVYRQFATRDDLLVAASDWIAEQYFADPRLPESIDEQLRQIELQPASWDEHPNLVRAMASTAVGQAIRSRRRSRRLGLISSALQEVTSNLPQADQRRAEAVFGYLSNMLAWVTMRDEHGLSGAEIGQALKWALATLAEDLRQRNEAAGRAGATRPRQPPTGRS
jgi:AcrR family transcriptional regulator